MRNLYEKRIDQFRDRSDKVVELFGNVGDGKTGMFHISSTKRSQWKLKCIAASGALMNGDTTAWEHVSVSLPDRCPLWNEMHQIKELFFYDDETVVQYHPPKSEYVNCHPYPALVASVDGGTDPSSWWNGRSNEQGKGK